MIITFLMAAMISGTEAANVGANLGAIAAATNGVAVR